MCSWDKLTLSISKIPNSFKNMESGSCPKTTHSCSLTPQLSLIQLPQTSAAIPHTVSHKGSHFQINSFTTNTEGTGYLLWPFRDQWMLSRNREWNSQRNQGSHKEGPEFYTRAQNLERKIPQPDSEEQNLHWNIMGSLKDWSHELLAYPPLLAS